MSEDILWIVWGTCFANSYYALLDEFWSRHKMSASDFDGNNGLITTFHQRLLHFFGYSRSTPNSQRLTWQLELKIDGLNHIQSVSTID